MGTLKEYFEPKTALWVEYEFALALVISGLGGVGMIRMNGAKVANRGFMGR